MPSYTDPDPLGNEIKAELVSAGEVNGRVQLQNGDDPNSVIEGLSKHTVVEAEPGTYSVSSTLDIPDYVSIVCPVGRMDDHPIKLVKEFDGELARIGTGHVMQGVEFDGNKANHTGNVVECRDQTCKESLYFACSFINGAGDGLVTRTFFANTVLGCRFSSNDGWGVRHLSKSSSGGSEYSQNFWGGFSQISVNGLGGVLWDDIAHNTVCYDGVTVANNNGPAFYGVGSSIGGKIFGNIEGNDGPAVLFESGTDGDQIFGYEIGGRLLNNNNNPTNVTDSGTRELGTIHTQGNAWVVSSISGSLAGTGGSTVPVAAYGFANEHSMGGGSIQGYDYVAHLESGCEIGLSQTQQQNITNGDTISGDGDGHSVNGRRVTDLNTSASVYLGSRTSTPHSPSGSGDVYIDTSSNPPAWKIDDPADSAWETM